jgi:hypothetical protein
MPNSQVVSQRLGSINRNLCAAPLYLERRGSPRTVCDLGGYDTIEMPGNDGRPTVLTFSNTANQEARVETLPRISINDPVTIHRLPGEPTRRVPFAVATAADIARLIALFGRAPRHRGEQPIWVTQG